MRVALLLSSCMLAAMSVAQNWALINPTYKYNYSNDGTDTISNQIFVTHVDTLGVDSFRYELNLIAKLCDTCTTPSQILLVNQPQFMQRKVDVGPTIWHFQDPGSVVILPQAGLGETWIFDTLAAITASVTTADLTQVFGNDEQRKVISLSTGDSIVISETYGVLSWNGHDLIGVHGPDLGNLIPSLLEMFPYQVGDEIEYVKSSSYFDGMSGWPGYATQYKFTFGNGVVGPEEITYSGSRINATWGWPLFNYNTGPYNITFGSSWVAGYPELPWIKLALSYPGQLVPMDSWSSGFLCTAEHGLDSLGRYKISSLRMPFLDSDSYSAMVHAYPQQLDTLTLLQYGDGLCTCYYDYDMGCGAEYVAGIGLMWAHEPHWEGGGEFYDLIGAVINGDTIGTVHSDEYLIGLSVEENGVTSSVIIGPNPANDFITVANIPLRSGNIEVLDATGRTCKTISTTGQDRMNINVSDLSPGLYFLKAGSTAIPQRFIITR